MKEEWIKGSPGRGSETGRADDDLDSGWDDEYEDCENSFDDHDDDTRFVSDDDEVSDEDAESGSEWDDGQLDDEESRYLLPGLHDDDEDSAARFGTRKIIGRDDRARVTKVGKFPFSAICSLQIYRRGKSQIGTGFYVGKNIVMTAGHNLCNNANLGSGYVDKVVVYAARNGSNTFEDQEVVSNRSQLKVARAWRDSRNKNLDWGVIILKDPFGQRFGAFSLGPWSPQELRASSYNVVGYPASKSTRTRGKYQMWADVGKIIRVGKRTLRYEMDTTGGQSGAPIIAWKAPKSFVVGVHNYGYSNFNQATRVTHDIAKAVEAIRGAKFF